MMRLLRTTIGALAVAATALTALPATAQAGGRLSDSETAGNYRCADNRVCDHPRGAYVYRHHGKPYRHWHGKRVYRHHQGNSDAAAVILGLTGLAIVGGAIASQNRTLPHTADPNYRRGHYRSAPNVITYESALEPWSPGWYRWCDARYRSFNPETGTFRGYDGRDHFCVPR